MIPIELIVDSDKRVTRVFEWNPTSGLDLDLATILFCMRYNIIASEQQILVQEARRLDSEGIYVNDDVIVPNLLLIGVTSMIGMVEVRIMEGESVRKAVKPVCEMLKMTLEECDGRMDEISNSLYYQHYTPSRPRYSTCF